METIQHKTVSAPMGSTLTLQKRIGAQHLHCRKGSMSISLAPTWLPWYSCRQQILYLADHSYRTVAPDLCGYGETTGAPINDHTEFSVFYLLGDVIGLLDAITSEGEKVFVVGHNWGAYIAWHLGMIRPDRVKAMVNLSVPVIPWNEKGDIEKIMRIAYGEENCISRFQEPGVIEAVPAKIGTRLSFERALNVNVVKSRDVVLQALGLTSGVVGSRVSDVTNFKVSLWEPPKYLRKGDGGIEVDEVVGRKAESSAGVGGEREKEDREVMNWRAEMGERRERWMRVDGGMREGGKGRERSGEREKGKEWRRKERADGRRGKGEENETEGRGGGREEERGVRLKERGRTREEDKKEREKKETEKREEGIKEERKEEKVAKREERRGERRGKKKSEKMLESDADEDDDGGETGGREKIDEGTRKIECKRLEMRKCGEIRKRGEEGGVMRGEGKKNIRNDTIERKEELRGGKERRVEGERK
ncbi:alpha/beta hydrolase fold-1 [Tanacetum coccineum]